MWAAVGREPVTTIFCFTVMIDFWSFLFFMGYFLRLEGIYQYCLDKYGCNFVEIYIGNPFTSIQIKQGARIAVCFTAGLGADQIDRSYCRTGAVWDAKQNIAMFKDNGVQLNQVNIEKIQESARMNNIPRVDTFSSSISSMLIGPVKK